MFAFISRIVNYFAKDPKPTRAVVPKKQAIPRDMRDQVWLKYHGASIEGRCYCCGKNIGKYGGQWHVSHVRAETKGGDISIENLRCCCRTCNLSMGNQNLYCYINEKNLTGPGAKKAKKYLSKHPSQKFDRRTNNWGK